MCAVINESYESGKILDYKNYLCNYRPVANPRLFEGLKILFANTNMDRSKLKTLLKLGGATILGKNRKFASFFFFA